MIRAFLNANVLFSAALRPRNCDYAFFRLAREGGCIPVASAYVLDEARGNLAIKAPSALSRLDDELAGLLELAAEPSAGIIAMVARVDLLVTGDRRHFGRLFGQHVHGVKILSLAEGLAALLAAVTGSGKET